MLCKLYFLCQFSFRIAMARFDVNRTFLESFCSRQDRQVKVIVKNCSEEQLKTIAELFLNLDSFVQTKQEKKQFKKSSKTLSSFFKKKWSIKLLRKFFVKNSKLVSFLVITFLAKLIEGIICSELLSDE